ncbi:MAG TPA: DegT/DnrJ/EryC1/StrS family aminotransferase [Alphaproteobacteria bacterium]|nr:DegT/DnrJ/EryC1/StrS family aminotransferase [Alphaproteobacteria bacterium]
MTPSYPMLSRYVVPDLPEAEAILPYLRRIDANRWYTNFGPLVTEFERRLLAYVRARDAVKGAPALHLTTLVTGYHALLIGLHVLRLPKGARVLAPAVTFPACPLAIRHAGCEPLLADVDAGGWQLTPAIARRVAAQTKIHAVMPVAVYGVPADAEAWDAFAEETGIAVIIDAAAALEAQAIPRRGLVAHSLHATKPFGIGEGGVLVARDPALIAEARRIANFGTEERITLQDGSNAKMSEFHAAVALAQLDRWGEVKRRRHAMLGRYRAAVEKIGGGLGFQQGLERATPSVVMLKAPTACADQVIAFAQARGVCAHRVYLPPLYRHPHFADAAVADAEGRVLPGAAALAEKAGALTASEDLLGTLFGLPFHALLTDGDIAYAMQVLGEALAAAQNPGTKAARKIPA